MTTKKASTAATETPKTARRPGLDRATYEIIDKVVALLTGEDEESEAYQLADDLLLEFSNNIHKGHPFHDLCTD